MAAMNLAALRLLTLLASVALLAPPARANHPRHGSG
jgi:hypothetical protein